MKLLWMSSGLEYFVWSQVDTKVAEDEHVDLA